MEAKKLDERWTPTSVHGSFAVNQLPSCTPKSRAISIDLPLLKFGWTFALQLAPEPKSKPCKWIPTTFSFRQQSGDISWGNTSIHAHLAFATEAPTPQNVAAEGEPNSDCTSLGTITTALSQTPSAVLRLATSYRFSSYQSVKFTVTVTVSGCPFDDGLFRAVSSHGNEVEAYAQLIRQSGNRVLSRSFATGCFFDVKFLSYSTHPTSRSTTRKLLPTYASLPVLEKYLKLPDSKLKDGWVNVLTESDHDNADATYFKQVSSPDEYEHELDSDFEDEDEVPTPLVKPCELSLPCERSLVITLEANQPESDTAEPGGGSWDSVATDKATGDQDCLPEEVSGGLSANFKQTVLVKFAAHRTWNSFLWYCYTGHVKFNKLKSQVEPGTRHLPVTQPEDGPPPCSPKSMYRLADLVGDKDLKAKALQAIGERMTEVNVLDETLSVFTSKYPDVRELQLSILQTHRKSPAVKKAFFRVIRDFNGIPNAESVLSIFYDHLVA